MQEVFFGYFGQIHHLPAGARQFQNARTGQEPEHPFLLVGKQFGGLDQPSNQVNKAGAVIHMAGGVDDHVVQFEMAGNISCRHLQQITSDHLAVIPFEIAKLVRIAHDDGYLVSGLHCLLCQVPAKVAGRAKDQDIFDGHLDLSCRLRSRRLISVPKTRVSIVRRCSVSHQPPNTRPGPNI